MISVGFMTVAGKIEYEYLKKFNLEFPMTSIHYKHAPHPSHIHIPTPNAHSTPPPHPTPKRFEIKLFEVQGSRIRD